MSLRLLLIEDDNDVAETIIAVFENFFEGTEIKHIAEGMAFRKGEWKRGKWDLVVLDLMLPGITGFEICEQLRAQNDMKTIPILALTGYDTLQNETRIKSVGASGYMAKPFEVDKFLKEVKRILGK